MTETLELPVSPKQPKQTKQTGPQTVADPINDPLRQQFAFEAFRIIVSKQAQDGKFSEETVGTWMWRFADAAMRGKKKLHRPSISQSGIVIGPPPEPIVPVPEALPPLDEVS